MQKDKIFVLANISEYGGSGPYNYANRRDFEPNRKSLFLSNKEVKFRHSIEGWKKKGLLIINVNGFLIGCMNSKKQF